MHKVIQKDDFIAPGIYHLISMQANSNEINSEWKIVKYCFG